jgi:hypothetical protein
MHKIEVAAEESRVPDDRAAEAEREPLLRVPDGQAVVARPDPVLLGAVSDLIRVLAPIQSRVADEAVAMVSSVANTPKAGIAAAAAS